MKNDITISAPLHFDKTAPILARMTDYGDNWPTVYIINNDKEVYIGETTSATVRIWQHLENPKRRGLQEVRLISGKTFNKSVALDLESFLISHMSADNKFHLQNSNAGQQKHNYYKKAEYESQFKKVWHNLQSLKLANQNLSQIENSNLFKYSPYKTLTADQYSVALEIICTIAQDIGGTTDRTFIVNGGPGTGKTVLGIYLMKLLSSRMDDDSDSGDAKLVEKLRLIKTEKPNLKIGLVISMSNLRNIVKETFSHTHGLNGTMVYAPSQIANSDEYFDILIVDEAHRLRQRRNLSQYAQYDQANTSLGLPKSSTELDWILKKSKCQILLYDQNQSIRAADVDTEDFLKLATTRELRSLQIKTQVRCLKGGQEYVNFINDVFSNQKATKRIKLPEYDLRVFDDIDEMVRAIKDKNAKHGLCRVVAGYAWKWRTKNRLIPAPKNDLETQQYINKGLYDIDIDGHRYIWNVKYESWISDQNSVNEIGCIHTIQGFDLNYAGVIIGNELKFDPVAQRIYIDPAEYHDRNGKINTSESELLEYVFNIYRVLCTRGMNGTYIYACDNNLREYLQALMS